VDRPRPVDPPKSLRVGAAPQSSCRPGPSPARFDLFPWSCANWPRCWPNRLGSHLAVRASAAIKKRGKLLPPTVAWLRPADLAYGSLELAALEYQARRGEIILLYEDETILWRFAMLRAAGAQSAACAPPDASAETESEQTRGVLKRQAWVRHRSWSRINQRCVAQCHWAVSTAPSKVFYKSCPLLMPRVTPIYASSDGHFSKIGKRSSWSSIAAGPSAHKLDATLAHYHGSCASISYRPIVDHLNPIEGFCGVMKDTISAGRCLAIFQQLYQRTRRVLMAHQERPIYAFHWSPVASSPQNFMGSARHATSHPGGDGM